MKKGIAFFGLILLSVLLVACSGAYNYGAPTQAPMQPAPQPAPAPQTTTGGAQINIQQPATAPSTALVSKTDVTIQNFAFNPATVTINAGTAVVWTNNDPVPHQIASDQAGMFSSSPLSQGDTYSFTFAQAGTYTYHCAIHTSMKGTIVVK